MLSMVGHPRLWKHVGCAPTGDARQGGNNIGLGNPNGVGFAHSPSPCSGNSTSVTQCSCARNLLSSTPSAISHCLQCWWPPPWQKPERDSGRPVEGYLKSTCSTCQALFQQQMHCRNVARTGGSLQVQFALASSMCAAGE